MPEVAEATVMELQRAGWLLVEDGNQGEYRPRPNEFGAGEVAFIRAADMDGGRVQFESAARINATARSRIIKGVGAGGDILLSHKGTVGKLALVSLDAPAFVCSPQTTFWRTLNEKKIDRYYLYYFMCSDEFRQQLNSRKGETDMADYVSLTAQREFIVRLPRIERQREIGRALGTLDDKIELNRQMNRTLEGLARAVFKSWFVDFDPVVAKSVGKKPLGMSAETAKLFPAAFQDSPLGPIPKGWRVGRLGEVMAPRRVAVLPAADPTEDFDHYSIPAYDEGHVPKRERGAAIRSNKYLVAEGCVLLSKLNPDTPRVWWPLKGERRSICSTEFIVGHPIAPVTREFLYGVLCSEVFTSDFALLVTGTSNSHQRVKPGDLEDMETVVPPDRVVAAYTHLASPLIQRGLANQIQSQTLAALRDTLLPKLMSGELRVGQAEKLAEEAV